MTRSSLHTSQRNAKRTIAFYNMLPNVFWSAVNITPVYLFCYRYLTPVLLFIFLAATIIGSILPKGFYDSLQLTKSPEMYKKLGVAFLNKVTQNGTFINQQIRKRIPGYRVISKKTVTQKKLMQQTYMFERFHFAMFLFFTLTALFALRHGHIAWCVVISLANIAYNIYPNLLQQYIRLRLTSFHRDKATAVPSQIVSGRV